MDVACCYGRVRVEPGDEFDMDYMPNGNTGRYVVTEFTGKAGIYSPSGLGGTVGINARHVETGEVIEFCGDSVAAAIWRLREKRPDQGNGG